MNSRIESNSRQLSLSPGLIASAALAGLVGIGLGIARQQPTQGSSPSPSIILLLLPLTSIADLLSIDTSIVVSSVVVSALLLATLVGAAVSDQSHKKKKNQRTCWRNNEHEYLRVRGDLMVEETKENGEQGVVEGKQQQVVETTASATPTAPAIELLEQQEPTSKMNGPRIEEDVVDDDEEEQEDVQVIEPSSISTTARAISVDSIIPTSINQPPPQPPTPPSSTSPELFCQTDPPPDPTNPPAHNHLPDESWTPVSDFPVSLTLPRKRMHLRALSFGQLSVSSSIGPWETFRELGPLIHTDSTSEDLRVAFATEHGTFLCSQPNSPFLTHGPFSPLNSIFIRIQQPDGSQLLKTREGLLVQVETDGKVKVGKVGTGLEMRVIAARGRV